MNYYVTTFYRFFPIENIENTKKELTDLAIQKNILGLIVLGTEGLNATVSASTAEDLKFFKTWLNERFGEFFFKDSESDIKPFRRFVVKTRPEIVTLGTPNLVPTKSQNHHLSPHEWNEVLKNEDVLLIDTRNWYETKIGTFKGAVNPHTDQFREFPEFIKKQNINKDKKILIFCTGGIRCEKGILELQNQGFENVYQLEGGIINYLQQSPNDQFEGECFVFDHRVALDQNLKPSKIYKLCPHCGQPGAIKINCDRCQAEAHVCENCKPLENKGNTCSKNCAYQITL